MSTNKTTSYKWEIADFDKQYGEAYSKKETLVSDVFSLVTRPSIQFEMFYGASTSTYLEDKTYGVALKKSGINQSLSFDLKIWMENEVGQKFNEYSAQNYEFKTVGDQCGFKFKTTGNDWDLFYVLYNNHESMFICCELLDLNPNNVPDENCDDEFHKNQWQLYEEEIHDAIIKVGEKEFKVLKSYFMAQSSVFKSMFLSKLKKGMTSKVQVNDVDVETMEHLIKWMYIGQLEDDSPIEELFAAADKYDIKLLKNTCIERMLSTLDLTNAFDRLILASTHNYAQLKDAALDCIAELSTPYFVVFLTSTVWFNLVKRNEAVAKEVGKLIQDKMCE